MRSFESCLVVVGSEGDDDDAVVAAVLGCVPQNASTHCQKTVVLMDALTVDIGTTALQAGAEQVSRTQQGCALLGSKHGPVVVERPGSRTHILPGSYACGSKGHSVDTPPAVDSHKDSSNVRALLEIAAEVVA